MLMSRLGMEDEIIHAGAPDDGISLILDKAWLSQATYPVGPGEQI